LVLGLGGGAILLSIVKSGKDIVRNTQLGHTNGAFWKNDRKVRAVRVGKASSEMPEFRQRSQEA